MKSTLSKIDKQSRENPNIDYSKCSRIIDDVKDNLNLVKSNFSKCTKNVLDKAANAEIEVLQVSKKTLDGLEKLKNHTDKCSRDIGDDIKGAFDCVASVSTNFYWCVVFT